MIEGGLRCCCDDGVSMSVAIGVVDRRARLRFDIALEARVGGLTTTTFSSRLFAFTVDVRLVSVLRFTLNMAK